MYGKMLYEGNMVVKDKAQAAEYFAKSAVLNNELASLYVGLMLFFGDGISRNRQYGAIFICFSIFRTFIFTVLFLIMFYIYKKKRSFFVWLFDF